MAKKRTVKKVVTKRDRKTPTKQASKGAGNGGIVPPPEHRWKPGQSGNPNGAPKLKLHLWTRFCKILENHDMIWLKATTLEIAGKTEPKLTKGMKIADVVAIRWAIDVVGGKWQQLQEAVNRDEGKVADVIETPDIMPPAVAIEILRIRDEKLKGK